MCIRDRLPRVKSYLGGIKEDLIVRTTLDMELQRKAEESLTKISQNYKSANQSAIVVLDLNGGVLAMVGGRDYGDSQFNRVTQAQRQPGSAFKLFVYLVALENGFQPSDLIEDSQISIEDWSPENYKKEFLTKLLFTIFLKTFFVLSLDKFLFEIGLYFEGAFNKLAIKAHSYLSLIHI